MPREPDVSRRSVLLGGLALLAAGTLPSVVRGSLGTGPAEDALARRLGDLIDSPSVRELGRHQLAELPARVTRAEIARDLLPPELDGQTAIASTDRDLIAALEARMVDDLRQGSLVSVDGWLLSRTEAHWCLLTVLER